MVLIAQKKTLRPTLLSLVNSNLGSNLEKISSVLMGILTLSSAVSVGLLMSFLLIKVSPHMRLGVESTLKFSQFAVM